MRRFTATFLLLFSCALTVVPVALATVAPTPHACCLRHEHRCHDSVARSSAVATIHGTGCCNHDCCRAASTSQKAQPRTRGTLASAQTIDVLAVDLLPTVPPQQVSILQSPRAPPRNALA